MDKLTNALLSASMLIASKEGIADEEQITVRANEIFTDASKEVPETEAGIEAKKQAVELVNAPVSAVQSPYVEKPQFDFNAYYDKSVNPSVTEIFAKIAQYPSLADTATNPSPELVATREADFDKLSIEVFAILNKNKVWTSAYQYLFKDMGGIIKQLDAIVNQQVLGHTQEIVSRTIGIRHPDPTDNTFKADFATYQDILDARDRVEQATGGKKEDYFRPKA